MLKKTFNYTDYNGVERTETRYFNLSETELIEMNLSVDGGLGALLQKIIDEQNGPAIVKYFKEIIMKSYCEKSLDGKRLVKSDELSTAFTQTEAYNQLFTEIFNDGKAAADFIKGILPKDAVAKATAVNVTVDGVSVIDA